VFLIIIIIIKCYVKRKEREGERERDYWTTNFFWTDSCSHKATPKMYKKP
jgi:hypothetical protein